MGKIFCRFIKLSVDVDEVFMQKNLPNVGQTVRSKKYGTLWRIMEKRERWQHTAHDPASGEGGLHFEKIGFQSI